MSKTSKTFRLSDSAFDNLDAIQQATGSNETACVEMALAALAKGLTGANEMNTARINRDDAKGEWTTYLEGKTIYKWDGKLWTGLPYAQGYNRGIELTPLTDAERDYLTSRGVLNGLENY